MKSWWLIAGSNELHCLQWRQLFYVVGYEGHCFQAQRQDVLFMEGAVQHPMKMFLQQGKSLPSCSQDSVEALRLDTIIMYTSWLEAELGAGQVAGMTGQSCYCSKSTFFFVLFHSVFTVEGQLLLYVLALEKYLTSLHLFFPISKMEIIVIMTFIIILLYYI